MRMVPGKYGGLKLNRNDRMPSMANGRKDQNPQISAHVLVNIQPKTGKCTILSMYCKRAQKTLHSSKVVRMVLIRCGRVAALCKPRLVIDRRCRY